MDCCYRRCRKAHVLLCAAHTPHEMESAKHPYELPPVHYTVIRAMGEQMGVGGDDSWGANVHPEYIPDVTKPVEFTFTFRGI